MALKNNNMQIIHKYGIACCKKSRRACTARNKRSPFLAVQALLLFGVSHFHISVLHPAGRGSLCQAAVMHHGAVEPKAAGEVSAGKAVSGEYPAGNIAAQSALAHNIDRLFVWNFS